MFRKKMFFKNDPWDRPWCKFYKKKSSKVDRIRTATSDKFCAKTRKEYAEFAKETKHINMTWMGGDSKFGKYLSVYEDIMCIYTSYTFDDLFHF